MKKVLFAYDGSDNSKRAVEQLIELGKRIRDLEIGVISVVPEADKKLLDQVPTYGEWHAECILKAEKDVDEVCEQLSANGLEAEPIVKVGSPALSIIEEAKEQGYDTIMIGHRGKLLGSVSIKIIDLSPVAVYIAS